MSVSFGNGVDLGNLVTATTNPLTGGIEIPVLAKAPVHTNDDSLALLGDSITLRNQQGSTAVWNNEGYFIVANMLMGQKYDIINVTGLSGYTIEQIAASGLPVILASGAKHCFVLAGTNNATDADAATIYDKLRTQLWEPLRDAGINVIAATVPPNGGWTAAQSAKIAHLNDMIRNAPASYPGMRVCDLWAATVDGATGSPKTGLFADGIHPSARGAMYFARAIYDALNGVDVVSRRRASGGRFDPNIISPNPLAFGNNATDVNGFILGTGGTGTGPDMWKVETDAAASTFTCSGGNARSQADQFDGRALDVEMTYGGDDQYFMASLRSETAVNADIYLDRAWAATTAKIAGQIVKPTAGRAGGFQFKAISSGTTDASEPTWPTVLGGTVADGTVTWMAIKDVAAGDIYETEVEVVFSALSGYVCPALRFAFDTATYSGVLRPLLLANGQQIPSADTNPVSPLVNTGTSYWDWVPLNKPIVIKSQRIIIPTQAEVSHIQPQFRLYGKNGTKASFKVQRFEMRRVG